MLWIIHNGLYRSGISSMMMLKEPLRALFIGLTFKPVSPFYELVNDHLGRMLSGGLIDFWINSVFNPRTEKTDGVIGPQVLTMEHLEMGFKFCLIPMMLGFILFIVEVSSKRSKKISKYLIKFCDCK